MDIETARILNEMNSSFYKEHAESFSSTRHGSWSGWSMALDAAGISSMPAQIADIACGNMRFEDFLASTFPNAPANIVCVDNCCELHDLSRAPEGTQLTFLEKDIVADLFKGNGIDIPQSDLIVCFGFMHHIPTFAARKQFLDSLFSKLTPGGTLIVSFWQFMSVDSIAEQACRLTSESNLELEENDYILGWQNSPTARRYCHNFDISQVRALSPVENPTLLEADGRTGKLNIYLIVRKTC